jgi:hypothetical protein
MLRPYVFVGYVLYVTSPPSPQPIRPTLPALRMPRGGRRATLGAALSFLVHAGIIALLVIRGRELLERAPGGEGERGGGGGRGGAVNFFTIPTTGPAAVDVPATLPVKVTDLPSLAELKVDLPPLELLRETLLPTVATGFRATGTPGQVPGAGGGRGSGVDAGTGADAGPGTGGEGGYIFVASPRTAIIPPLGKVPGSVLSRTFRVRFWVNAEGRVTRVEVDPPIADADYGREFQQRMMAYRFYPARTRDGRNVASVVTVPLRIGN